MTFITPETLDDLLPQTQCGLCGYKGCLPYAEAMVYEKAPFNLCPPGGVKTLNALAQVLNQDPAPYLAEMEIKTKPKMLAIIREDECIGCTKCISACPVDAIIGSAKQMHSIISADCTGCELCIPPCPVDCIDMVPLDENDLRDEKLTADHARKKFLAKNIRLEKEKKSKKNASQVLSLLQRKKYIQAAVARVKVKKIK